MSLFDEFLGCLITREIDVLVRHGLLPELPPGWKAVYGRGPAMAALDAVRRENRKRQDDLMAITRQIARAG